MDPFSPGTVLAAVLLAIAAGLLAGWYVRGWAARGPSLDYDPLDPPAPYPANDPEARRRALDQLNRPLGR